MWLSIIVRLYQVTVLIVINYYSFHYYRASYNLFQNHVPHTL